MGRGHFDAGTRGTGSHSFFWGGGFGPKGPECCFALVWKSLIIWKTAGSKNDRKQEDTELPKLREEKQVETYPRVRARHPENDQEDCQMSAGTRVCCALGKQKQGLSFILPNGVWKLCAPMLHLCKQSVRSAP